MLVLADNRRGMARVRPEDEIGAEALLRLKQLLADMEWNEDWAIVTLANEITAELGYNAPKKTVERWFERSIPAGHIFNVATVIGIDPRWLAAHPGVDKEHAIIEGGLYDREITRLQRHQNRQSAPTRKPRPVKGRAV